MCAVRLSPVPTFFLRMWCWLQSKRHVGNNEFSNCTFIRTLTQLALVASNRDTHGAMDERSHLRHHRNLYCIVYLAMIVLLSPYYPDGYSLCCENIH